MNPDEIRAMIDHYSVLPFNDPRRSEMMRVVAGSTEELRAYYFSVLAQQERLRLAVVANAPALPSSLTKRLLAIPNEKSGRFLLPMRLAVPLAVAAALIITVFIGFHLFSVAQRDTRLKSLAWQSLSLMVNQPNLLGGTVTQAELQKDFPKMPFTAELYNYGGYVLKGFAGVSISGQPGLLTQWQRGKAGCTMLQFPLSLIPAGTSAQGVTIHLSADVHGGKSDDKTYTVTLWPDERGHCGWAVVLKGNQRYHPFDLSG